MLLYVLDSKMITGNNAGRPAHSIHHNIIVPILTELKGYLRTYMLDCSHPRVKEMRKEKHDTYNSFMKGVCDKKNKERQPSIVIYKQPELRRNPYTGEKMKTEMVPYQHQTVTP